MRETPAEPVLRRADALAAGWTDSAIRHAVDSGRWERLRPGIYAPRQDPPSDARAAERADHLTRAIAAVLACPRGALSHHTAAVANGPPLLGSLPRWPGLTVPSGTALRHLVDVHLHRAALPLRHIVDIDGRRVISIARTVADLARESGIAAGLVAADAALHVGATDPAALAAVVAECSRWPGVTRARRVVELADAAAESPLESLSRLRMIEHGLPAPTPQQVIRDTAGRFVARVDFYWDEYGVVGEADGLGKYDSPASRIGEKKRELQLESCGLIMVRWGWDDVWQFGAVADRLRSRFRLGLRRDDPRGWLTPTISDFASEFDAM